MGSLSAPPAGTPSFHTFININVEDDFLPTDRRIEQISAELSELSAALTENVAHKDVCSENLKNK